MKLTTNLVSALSNLARVNSSILLTEGNVLSVKRSTQSLASVKLDEPVTHEAAIYDLPLFIKTLGLFSDTDTELDIQEGLITIKSKSQKASYNLTERRLIESCVATANVRQVADSGKLGENLLTFDLSEEVFGQITSNAKTLGLPHISFLVKGGDLSVAMGDKDNRGKNKIETMIGTNTGCPDLEYVFNTEEFMKIPAGNYEMSFYKDVAAFTLLSETFDMFLCAEIEHTVKVA